MFTVTPDLKKLLEEVAPVLEGVCQNLKRETPYTHKDLSDLRDACNYSAQTIQSVRDMANDS